MLRSMTAFAHHASQGSWGSAVWEGRSVNHRYLEVTIRLPETLRDLEPQLRESIREKLHRGKVEFFLKYIPQYGPEEKLSINVGLVKLMAQASQQITPYFTNTAPVDLLQVLNSPGVLQISETNLENVKKLLLELFAETLNDLVANRETEGREIAEILKNRLIKVEAQLDIIKNLVPTLLSSQREKLLTRFAEAKIELEPNRLEQEMLLLAQKIDIMEEVDRMSIHIKETRRTLQQGNAVGRRLDFLMQEINREANTIAAKSVDAKVSAAAVEIRILVEQMREQIQNVE